MIIIEQSGALALIQDLGRPGLAHLGVSPSGAADRTALRLANRLVGNVEGAAAVECLLGGLVVRSASLLWVAVTGAPTEVLVNGAPTGSHSSIPLRPEDTLTIQAPGHGIRNYLAVRGGVKGHRILGSRSTDTLSGLGPEPLTPGQHLKVGRPKRRFPDTNLAPPNQPRKTLRVLPGPRRDWFTHEAWETLVEPAVEREPGFEPGRHPAGGPDSAAQPPRRVALRRSGPRCRSGSGVGTTVDLRLRPSRHRGLPGDRCVDRTRRRPRRPVAAG